MVDTLNHRVQAFTPEGAFLSSFGRLGNGTGDFASPKGAAMDDKGRVYVVDALFDAVQIFDPGGRLLLALGRQGNKKGNSGFQRGSPSTAVTSCTWRTATTAGSRFSASCPRGGPHEAAGFPGRVLPVRSSSGVGRARPGGDRCHEAQPVRERTGTEVKGVSEQEVCVFCHTPHNANPAVPLWNHQQTNAAHTMYSSDYLTDKGYAMPASVNQRSKLCLSCHDGTVALGAVYNVRGQPATIAMQKSGAPITTMPLDVAGYLGTNLTNDHPVSIGYDTGVSEIELVTPAPPLFPAKGAVKLYPPSGGTVAGTVECTSCHDPHTDTFPKFLVASNLNAGLCRTCHQKTNFDGSIHAVSSVPFTTIYGGTTVAQAACVACHKSHSGAGVPYILERQEEQTCYNGTSTSCHGSSITTYQGGGHGAEHPEHVRRESRQAPGGDVGEAPKHRYAGDARPRKPPRRMLGLPQPSPGSAGPAHAGEQPRGKRPQGSERGEPQLRRKSGGARFVYTRFPRDVRVRGLPQVPLELHDRIRHGERRREPGRASQPKQSFLPSRGRRREEPGDTGFGVRAGNSVGLHGL